MYAVCDSSLPLSQCYYFRGSYVSAVKSFMSYFPSCSEILIFRDCGRSHKLADLQFVECISSKKIKKIVSLSA